MARVATTTDFEISRDAKYIAAKLYVPAISIDLVTELYGMRKLYNSAIITERRVKLLVGWITLDNPDIVKYITGGYASIPSNIADLIIADMKSSFLDRCEHIISLMQLYNPDTYLLNSMIKFRQVISDNYEYICDGARYLTMVDVFNAHPERVYNDARWIETYNMNKMLSDIRKDYVRGCSSRYISIERIYRTYENYYNQILAIIMIGICRDNYIR